MHLKGCLSINLLVLVIILLLDGENFLVHEEDVPLPVLVCRWRRCSALVGQIFFKT
jgi:hypothetical protein